MIYPNLWKLFSQSQVQEESGVTPLVDNNNYYFCIYPSTYRKLEARIHQLSYAAQTVCMLKFLLGGEKDTLRI